MYTQHNDPKVLRIKNKTSASGEDSVLFAWYLHGTSEKFEAFQCNRIHSGNTCVSLEGSILMQKYYIPCAYSFFFFLAFN